MSDQDVVEMELVGTHSERGNRDEALPEGAQRQLGRQSASPPARRLRRQGVALWRGVDRAPAKYFWSSVNSQLSIRDFDEFIIRLHRAPAVTSLRVRVSLALPLDPQH